MAVQVDRAVEDDASGNRIFDSIIFVVGKWPKLLAWSGLAAAIAYGLASLAPETYISKTYLALKEDGARDVEAMVRTPAILNAALAKFPQPGKNIDLQNQALMEAIRFSVPPHLSRKLSPVTVLEVIQPNATQARDLNQYLVDTWLELTKPRPFSRKQIESQLERAEAQLTSVTGVLERLQKETPTLVVPGSLQGELATPLVSLLQQRDSHVQVITNLKNSLTGQTTDVVIASASLPTEPDHARRKIIAAVAAVVTAIMLGFSLMLRQLVPRQSELLISALIPWKKSKSNVD